MTSARSATRSTLAPSLSPPHHRRHHHHHIFVQDAQLSQKDRAAGCVIVFAKSETLELGDIFYGHYTSIFNHCDIIGMKICRIP